MHDTPPACTCSCHYGGRFASCNVPEGCAHLHPDGHVDSPVGAELDLVRPSSACLLCPPPGPSRKAWTPADRGYKTCSDCLDKCRETLADIARRYLLLNPRPGTSIEHGSRGAPGFGSRPAASPHVICMTDWRSHPCEVGNDQVVYVFDANVDEFLQPGQHGPRRGGFVERREVWRGSDGRPHEEQTDPPRSVAKALAGWAEVIAAERDMTVPLTRQVPDLVRWLDGQLDWLTRQEWVTDVAEDLRALVAQLRPVTGDPPGTKFGACPNITDEETQALCGAPLRTPAPGVDTITCTSCRRPWKRPDWEHLGRLIQHRRIETLRAS